jgi:hypothetical protein
MVIGVDEGKSLVKKLRNISSSYIEWSLFCVLCFGDAPTLAFLEVGVGEGFASWEEATIVLPSSLSVDTLMTLTWERGVAVWWRGVSCTE